MKRYLIAALLIVMAGAAEAAPRQIVTDAARRPNVPARLLHGIVMAESRYQCGAYNRRTGASGIGQVLPSTARSVGVYGNLLDCHNGIEAAAGYLHAALERARGDWGGAATLYNRGLGASPSHSGYSNHVMQFAMGDK